MGQVRLLGRWYPDNKLVGKIHRQSINGKTYSLNCQSSASRDVRQLESFWCFSGVLDGECLTIMRKESYFLRRGGRDMTYTPLKLAVSFKINSPGDTIVVE